MWKDMIVISCRWATKCWRDWYTYIPIIQNTQHVWTSWRLLNHIAHEAVRSACNLRHPCHQRETELSSYSDEMQHFHLPTFSPNREVWSDLNVVGLRPLATESSRWHGNASTNQKIPWRSWRHPWSTIEPEGWEVAALFSATRECKELRSPSLGHHRQMPGGKNKLQKSTQNNGEAKTLVSCYS